MSQRRPDPHSTPAASPPSVPAPVPPAAARTTGGGCLLRLAWFLLGNILLALSAVGISQHRGGFLGGWDVVFWATVALLIPIRYLDIVCFHGQTASGEPATLAHWRRYAVLLSLLAGAAWGACHAWAWLHR